MGGPLPVYVCTARSKTQHNLPPTQQKHNKHTKHSLITVNTIKVPEGVDWAALIKVREKGGRERERERERAKKGAPALRV